MERRIAKFEKVSKEQFCKDMIDAIPQFWKTELELGNTIEQSYKKLEMIWENIQIPKRATTGSAGYDLRSTINMLLKPGQSVKMPTGLRCIIDDGWVLCYFPRSGYGTKYKFRFDNTTPIIDCDYSESDNEGHIILQFSVEGEKELEIIEGDKIAQGIFLPFGIAKNDEVTDIRNGGFGSTGK